MRAFRDAFRDALGGLIEEVVVGTGPCGELRFPSYPEANGWRFPGVRARSTSYDVVLLTHVCHEPSTVSRRACELYQDRRMTCRGQGILAGC